MLKLRFLEPNFKRKFKKSVFAGVRHQPAFSWNFEYIKVRKLTGWITFITRMSTYFLHFKKLFRDGIHILALFDTTCSMSLRVSEISVPQIDAKLFQKQMQISHHFHWDNLSMCCVYIRWQFPSYCSLDK